MKFISAALKKQTMICKKKTGQDKSLPVFLAVFGARDMPKPLKEPPRHGFGLIALARTVKSS